MIADTGIISPARKIEKITPFAIIFNFDNAKAVSEEIKTTIITLGTEIIRLFKRLLGILVSEETVI